MIRSAGETTRRRLAWAVMGMLALYWPLAFLATHLPLKPVAPAALPLDKVFHFGSFAVLGFLLTTLLALRGGWHWSHALIAVALAAAYGVVDELTQIPVGRTAELLDWLADVTGASVGAVVAGAASKLLRPRG